MPKTKLWDPVAEEIRALKMTPLGSLLKELTPGKIDMGATGVNAEEPILVCYAKGEEGVRRLMDAYRWAAEKAQAEKGWQVKVDGDLPAPMPTTSSPPRSGEPPGTP